MHYFKKFKSSFAEMRKIRSVAACGMLVALYVLLSFFFSIYFTPSFRFEINFLVLAAAGYLYGPTTAMAVGMAGDLVQHFIKPAGPYFPGFTLSAMMIGLIFGVILYKEKDSVLRSCIACATVTVVVELLMNTFFLSILYGNGFFAMLPLRLLQKGISLVLMCLLTVALTKVLQSAKKHITK